MLLLNIMRNFDIIKYNIIILDYIDSKRPITVTIRLSLSILFLSLKKKNDTKMFVIDQMKYIYIHVLLFYYF